LGEKKGAGKRIISGIDLESLMEMHPLDIVNDAGSFLPFTDIIETEDSFVIELEVPGIKKENLAIEVSDNYIYVSGKKTRDDRESKVRVKYYRMGRIYGAFKRVFEIPLPFNMHEVRAKLEKGVLTITLPKIVDKRQKKIKVEIE